MIVFFYIFKQLNGFEYIQPIDTKVDNFIRNNFSQNFKYLVHYTSDYIGIYTSILIIVCMFFKFKNKYYWSLQMLCYSFSLVIVWITKYLVCRARPSMELIATIDYYSFPSAHALITFVGYYFLAYMLSLKSDKKTQIAYYIIATTLVVSVSFTRIYLNVHYFTDIIGALLFGIIILKCLINIVEKNFKRKLL